ncbi:MAG: hypothetical protein QXH30_02765 [Candidatus Bilamarchaeaceae archaeon]
MAEKKEGKAGKKEKSIRPYQKKRHCPKCGPGVSLAAHKNRYSCGKCGYYEKK